MNNSTKFIFICVLIVILIVFLIRAYRTPNIEIHVEKPPPRKIIGEGINAFANNNNKKGERHGKNTREGKCRQIIEDLFGDEFPTKRPSFLKNPKTGKNLELDGYNARLGKAFEYNGEQHYIFPNTFHKTQEQYEEQLKRDEFKANKCKENGIQLCIIPYTVPDEELTSFIMNCFREGY
jgi:hypothetical protein